MESVLNGYNGTIMAYGQTGAGKTYTMTGRLFPSASIQKTMNNLLTLFLRGARYRNEVLALESKLDFKTPSMVFPHLLKPIQVAGRDGALATGSDRGIVLRTVQQVCDSGSYQQPAASELENPW